MTDQDPGQVMTIKRFNQIRTEQMRAQLSSAMTEAVRKFNRSIIEINNVVGQQRIKAQQEKK